MSNQSLQNSFKEFCKINKFEINKNQVEIINSLDNFLNSKNFFLIIFLNQKIRRAFI